MFSKVFFSMLLVGLCLPFAAQAQNWNQIIKAVASDRAAGDQFGYSVAISGDYAIVGAYAENEDATGGATASAAGSAYFFQRTVASSCPSSNTLYVNVSGGTGDGSTWANAYASLGDALATAHACSNVTLIKVAAGTYKPSKKPFNSGTEMTTTDGRDVTFQIPDGVTIEGGYDASTGNRNITANVTTLSGDIGTASDNTDNCYHVVLTSTTSSNTTSTIKIDGFSITGGNANGSSNITVNGNVVFRSNAGGIYTLYGKPTLTNNTIHSNSVSANGGGILAFYGTPTLTNNTIYSNSASRNGGGINTESSTTTLTNNTIYSNSANNGGGILNWYGTNTLTNNIFWQNKKGTDATVAGSDFSGGTNTFNNNLLQLASGSYTSANSNNLGSGASGNIFAQDPLFVSTTAPINLALQASSPAINAGISGVGIPTTDITGATRTGNPDLGAYEYFAPVCTNPTAYNVTGGGSYCAGGTGVAIGLANSETGVTYQLKRGTTDISTQSGTTGQPISFGNQTAAGTYTVVATRTTGGCTATMTGSAVVTMNAKPTVSITGANPITVGATTTLSPTTGGTWTSSNMAVATVISTGVVTGVSSGTATFTFTQTGTNCVSDATSSVTVTSAVVCPSSNTLHVNASVSGGTGDGSTWANAYASLSDALAKAHTCSNITTIKVAAGTYKPTKKPFNSGAEIALNVSGGATTNRDFTFHIPDNVTIEGGYDASTGNRNITANVTTLSGDIGTASDNTDNCYHVVLTSTASSNTTSTIKIDGFAITAGNANGNTPITVNGNMVFSNNGGGIFTNNGTATLTNNTIYSNSTIYNGGGICTNNGTATLTNNAIYSNSGDLGGGIYTNNGTATLTNNTIYSNSANSTGGGICTNNGTATLTNNTIYSNSSKYDGGGISTSGSTLTNNIFWGNKKGTNATVAGADFFGGTNTFKNNLLQLASGSYTSANINNLGSGASGNIFAQDPLFVAPLTPNGGDNISGTSDDGLRLQACSPAVNTGLNSAVSSIATDITGATRVQQTTVDMGAYESSHATPTTPTLTLGAIPAICAGAMSFTIPYTATTGSPTAYSVSGTGITAVTDGAMPNSSPITVSLSAAATTGTPPSYTLTVKNATGCVSTAYTGTVTVNAVPTLSAGTPTQPTTCGGIGSIRFTTSLPTGTYTITYKKDGVPQMGVNVMVGSSTRVAAGAFSANVFTLSGLTAGTYTDFKIVHGGCDVVAAGPVTLTDPTAPTAFSVSGGSSFCTGGTGSVVGLSGSQTGVSYQLKRGSDDVGSPVAGSGSAISFGNHTTTGVYTIVATNTTTLCSTTMTGNATINNFPQPQASISGNATVCKDNAPSLVSFTATVGTAPYIFSYKINNGTTQTISSNTATATLLHPTNVSGVFEYSLVGLQDGNGCSQAQSGSITVNVLTKPSITLAVNGLTLGEGNTQTVCDLDANPVNSLQFTVGTACLVGNPVWRVQIGGGAWSAWSSTAPNSQASDNQTYRYQAACDANCTNTYTELIAVAINYRASVPQNVSLVADGTTVAAGESKEICDQSGNTITFNATCAAGERLLYSVDGGSYLPTVPSQIVDGQFHNYRVRCQKSDGTPSCVETESGLMRLKISTIAAAPVASLNVNSGCGTPTSFSGTATCPTGFSTVWYNATTNVALPNLPALTPNETTSYYARCQNDLGCQSANSNTVSFTLTPVNEAPVVVVSSDLVCTGQEVTVSTTCPAGASVLWNTGVTESSFKVAFSNVTTQGYSAKCVFANGCQSAVSAAKSVRWKGFELTIINIGQSQSAIKTNDRAAWASQFVTPDGGPSLDNSTESNPTLYFTENVNKTGPRYWTINADACALGTDGSMTFDMLATPETGLVRSFNTHENNAPYFMYANRAGWTELYAQNHPAYGFYEDNGSGGNVYDEGLPKGLYKLGVRYWDMKGWGSIYPSTRKPQGSVLAYQEYWFRIQSKDGIGTGAARVASDNNLSSRRDLSPLTFAQVMPNPVSSVLRLKVTDAKNQKINVSLLDASGRTMLQRGFVPETNQHQEEFDVREIANGMYFLKVNAADKQATLKVVKVQ